MNTSRPLPWVFVLPTLLLLGIFVIYPAIYSLYLSFHDVHPFTGATFFNSGIHYKELFASSEYRSSLSTSLRFALYTVPSAIFISMCIALALDSKPWCRNLLRTIFLLPVGISSAMAAMLWIFLFNPTAGYLNYALSLIGISGPAWLTSPDWALVSVAIATVWKEIGFNVIFLLAGLAGVPKDLHEAAIIDGAGASARFWHITLPMISPTIFFISVVSVIHSFESFGQIHILTRGGPNGATNILVYNLYRDAFEYFRAGFASAQSVILFAIVLVFTVFQFYIGKKRVHYG